MAALVARPGAAPAGMLGLGQGLARASFTFRYSPGWKSMTCTLKSWCGVCGSSLRSANASPGTGSTGCASAAPCSACGPRAPPVCASPMPDRLLPACYTLLSVRRSAQVTSGCALRSLRVHHRVQAPRRSCVGREVGASACDIL